MMLARTARHHTKTRFTKTVHPKMNPFSLALMIQVRRLSRQNVPHRSGHEEEATLPARDRCASITSVASAPTSEIQQKVKLSSRQCGWHLAD